MSPTNAPSLQLVPQKMAATNVVGRISPPCQVMFGELEGGAPWPFAQWIPSMGGSRADDRASSGSPWLEVLASPPLPPQETAASAAAVIHGR